MLITKIMVFKNPEILKRNYLLIRGHPQKVRNCEVEHPQIEQPQFHAISLSWLALMVLIQRVPQFRSPEYRRIIHHVAFSSIRTEKNPVAKNLLCHESRHQKD